MALVVRYGSVEILHLASLRARIANSKLSQQKQLHPQLQWIEINALKEKEKEKEKKG
ncbi:hypothetical protein [Photobacterium sp. GSS17]|uniref:hypothetical protein n=1 Tax=Photobacterium sp. GSS17 TaxID=3020715 RepID=UPI00235EAF77|nr:hypothetical protein [Photobacterium sp. GSS17]